MTPRNQKIAAPTGGPATERFRAFVFCGLKNMGRYADKETARSVKPMPTARQDRYLDAPPVANS